MVTLPTLGIDVAKASLALALFDGHTYHTHALANTAAGHRALQHWLTRHAPPDCLCCLQATGRYGEALATALHAAGYRVAVVNPARTKAYATSRLQRNKTDRVDAQLIAHFAATQAVVLWSPPSAAELTLRERVRYRSVLAKQQQATRNRLASGVCDAVVQAHLQAHLSFVQSQRATLEQQIAHLITNDARLQHHVRLLCSIPGIGFQTATLLLAELGDFSTFARPAQLAAYVGLSPRRHESGSSVRQPGRLSKIGAPRVRTALYFPALTALQHNPVVRALGERLAQRGKCKAVIVGAAMRKLVYLAFGVLKHGTPFDPHHDLIVS